MAHRCNALPLCAGLFKSRQLSYLRVDIVILSYGPIKDTYSYFCYKTRIFGSYCLKTSFREYYRQKTRHNTMVSTTKRTSCKDISYFVNNYYHYPLLYNLSIITISVFFTILQLKLPYNDIFYHVNKKIAS
jgi:hypothetical protein